MAHLLQDEEYGDRYNTRFTCLFNDIIEMQVFTAEILLQ